MTEEQIKEELSKHFIGVVAHASGIKCMRPDGDHGVDLTFCPVTKRVEPDGRVRYLDSTNKLDIQLKATTQASIKKVDGCIGYDLEAKNFNDLIYRINDPLPLYLILVVLESNPPACLEMSENDLRLLGRAYWYLPKKSDAKTTNTKTQRIKIPLANQLNGKFLHAIYENVGIQL